MRKFISLLLALAMVFSLAIVASAETTTDYKDKVDKSVNFNKTYEISNGTSPAETFAFSFIPYAAVDSDNTNIFASVKDKMPEIANVSVSFDALTATTDKDISVSVTADDFPGLGVYTYQVNEVIPADKTAGVTYNETPVYLVITILRDEDNNQQYVAAIHYSTADGVKTGTVTNKYEAGSLSVTKKITGNMANMEDTFNFTVTFTAPKGEVLKSDILMSVAGAEPTSVSYTSGAASATATFELGHDMTATFTNIPEGVTYTVEEDTPDDYVLKSEVYSDESKTISDGDKDTAVFTNDKTQGVDTGITLDSIPFVLILAVCAGAAVLFLIKRRSVEF